MSDAMTTQTRRVAGFDQVELRTTGDVTLVAGDNEGLTVTAPANLLPKIETSVLDNRLILELDLSWWEKLRGGGHPDIRYQVQLRTLRGLTLAGSGRMHAGRVETHNMQIAVTGSGMLEIDHLEAETLQVTISGHGDLEISGQVDEQWIAIHGAGTYEAMDLESRRASVHISGQGKLSVHASESLDVDITGTGEVTYGGTAQLSQTVSGAGHIQHI